ncbi:putative CENP-V/GFA domain, Mss4-like superfamily protein [Septoria linicola]|nr:putative CENP-V/GFA domain, Mss4-like superfamily protein [Septoria linicola]
MLVHAPTTANTPPSPSIYQIPLSSFTLLSGTPKTWTKFSDFSRDFTNHFCAACGVVLYRTGGDPAVKDCVGLRAGVLDDQSIVNETRPMMEVWPESRPKWRERVEGAMQLRGQTEAVEDEFWDGDGTRKGVEEREAWLGRGEVRVGLRENGDGLCSFCKFTV